MEKALHVLRGWLKEELKRFQLPWHKFRVKNANVVNKNTIEDQEYLLQ